MYSPAATVTAAKIRRMIQGGTIKVITERVSPRVFRVVALPAPSDREKTQMYVQRYLMLDATDTDYAPWYIASSPSSPCHAPGWR